MRVFAWVADRATRHGFDVEVLDLRDRSLSFFQEHMGSIGDFADPTYSDPVVRAWNAKVAEGDADVIIAAEYDHSVPAAASPTAPARSSTSRWSRSRRRPCRCATPC